jgi:site-specific recombinase XerD
MSSRFTYANGANHDLDLLHDSVAPGPDQSSGTRHSPDRQKGSVRNEPRSGSVAAARSPATASSEGRSSTPRADCGEMRADRAVQTRKQEEMRHPPTVWVDQAHAEEPLDRLRRDYVDYLRGRAQPTSPDTVIKYNASLLAFIRFLERQGEEQVLGSVTPGLINAWVNEQRSIGRSEDGIASRLGSLKVFSSKYIYKHLELTTRDLLMKVPRITPPEKPAEILTKREIEQVLATYDRPTFEDIRDRALVGTYIATGLRFREVLELPFDGLDRVSGELRFIRGKGNKERMARLSPAALKYVKEYLRLRPGIGLSDQFWLQADGKPLHYWGGQSIMRRLRARSGIARLHWHLFRHGFAQTALVKGAPAALVQEMLGHSTNVMTRRYLGRARQTEAARQMPNFSPI